MSDAITSREYPLCSAAGLLRDTGHFELRRVVSTAALYKHLGWPRYRRFCLEMQNRLHGGIEPGKVEKFLRECNGH
jgi:hypothetical protein